MPTSNKNKETRNFRVKLKNGSETGHFTGSTPRIAASKALTFLSTEYKTNKSMQFTIRETTQNSKKKEYSYEGKRQKLDKVEKVTYKTKDGRQVTISHKYKNQLKRKYN